MAQVLRILKSICPSLLNIKSDKKKAEPFPDILQVLECHSRNTDSIIHLFKEPSVESCSCKGCRNGVIKDLHMTCCVYDNVMYYPMPMPIPKPIRIGDRESNVEYTSFADARILPFTNKHQPSLEAARNFARCYKAEKDRCQQSSASYRKVAYDFAHHKAQEQVEFQGWSCKESSWSSGVQELPQASLHLLHDVSV
jgi:hypothetical protein